MDKFLVSWRKYAKQNAEKENEDQSLPQNSSETTEVSQIQHIHSNVESSSSKCESSVSEANKTSSHKRSYIPSWKEDFPWLTYDDTIEKAFCSPCREAYNVLNIKVPSGSVNNNRVYSSFVKDGFSNWNKARDRFKSHEKTDVHRQAVTSVCNQKTTNVSCMISNQLSKERQDARFCLLKIFETIRFLAVQGLPLRGNIEENSNFIQVLRLRSIDNSILLNWMQRSKYRWVSHDIMDEILSMMSLHVQRILAANISKQPFYAIMSDETTDSSRKEQMSLNFRTVDENLDIHENFLGFYDVPSTDSKTLFDVLKDVLVRFNLKFLNCRGQCYDGANNMSGDYTGLQTRVREEEARAYYTHCAGHNISLVALGSLMAIPEIADFLSVFKELITFIRASSKRMNIFKNIQLQTDDHSEEDEPNVSLKPFCPTRWTVRVISLKSVKSNYKEILNFCDFVGSDPKTSTDAGIKARGFAVYLRKFDTIMYLNIVIETLKKN